MAKFSTADKRAAFRKLHASGCFVIPNPWNVGSARTLQGLGFKALATTSSGFAHAQGLPDGGVSFEEALAHFRELAQAVDVPLNADFEGGFADAPEAVAQNVKRCIETGIAGLSVEDYTGNDADPLYAFDLAVARVRAARQAIGDSGVLLTGRSEGLIRGRPDMDEIVRRLKAFSEAGADCLYAPGLKTRAEIESAVKAVAPKPVNLLMSAPLGFTVKDVEAMGVRRISVGGTLARVAMDGFIKAARAIAEHGTFEAFGGVISNAELNKFFRDAGPGN